MLSGRLKLGNTDFFFDALSSESKVNSFSLTEDEKELYKLFVVKPVPLEEFISGEDYLGSVMSGAKLSDIQYDAVRHFTQVLYTETYDKLANTWDSRFKPVRNVNNLAIAWGKGSGKDFCIQIGFAYIAYQLLCLKSPQEYFGVPKNTYIHLLNIAISATQALTVFYTPLRDLLVASPFFKDKFVGDTPTPRASTMYLKHNIVLVSGHSEAASLEGKNILAGVLDEIAGFPTEADASSTGRALTKTAEGLIKMIKSSAQTRFPDTSKVALISFSRRKGDAIMQAVAEAKEDEKEYGEESNYYYSLKETWAVNPRWQKYEFISIPQTEKLVPNAPSILKDYRRNAAFAKGFYECDPQDSDNPYFQDRDAVIKAFNTRELNVEPLHIEYYFGTDQTEGTTYPRWQVDFRLGNLTPKPGAIYSIHADMAIKSDVAGIAMSHVKERILQESVNIEGYLEEEYRPLIEVDFVTSFKHDMAAVTPTGEVMPREIQIRWFRKLVLWLKDQGFNIAHVSMDGFNSADSLQILEAQGFKTERLSTDVNNILWDTLKDVMYDGRLDAYSMLKYNDKTDKFEPVSRVQNEILRLTKLDNGKVDHPADYGKDHADALAGSVFGAIAVGGEEEDEDFEGNPFTGYDDNVFDGFADLSQGFNYSLDKNMFGNSSNFTSGIESGFGNGSGFF